MIACARPARFGRGEQTLTDLTGLDWDAILAEVRDELGLPARARLRAEPHALLVYGKGQFFLPHQDSEKDDTMIGTLVVSLPSSHDQLGGDLLALPRGGERGVSGLGNTTYDALFKRVDILLGSPVRLSSALLILRVRSASTSSMAVSDLIPPRFTTGPEIA
jgi:hypothetical protein